jgi:hypothetical protein
MSRNSIARHRAPEWSRSALIKDANAQRLARRAPQYSQGVGRHALPLHGARADQVRVVAEFFYLHGELLFA